MITKTRYQYHLALRHVKRNERIIRMNNMADSIISSNNYRDFWTEVKKLRGKSTNMPTVVDNAHGQDNIAEVFSKKYEELYNVVSYDRRQMAGLKSQLDRLICDHDNSNCCHNVTVNDILSGVRHLKPGKHDGNKGHFSNHLLNGSARLHVYISLLFDSMLSHGFVPSDFLLSTLIPIPKNKRKSLNMSDNYRAIALSSILGKLFDNILLHKCEDIFLTSDLQFGFKKKHSTSHCTFVVNEVLQYYNNNNSSVYIALLDASQAFDRVEYVKLFNLLISKGICPVIARLLVVLFTNQAVRVKWGDHVSYTLMSPIV